MLFAKPNVEHTAITLFRDMPGIDYSYYYESNDVALEPPPRTV